jgi:hypothetical protein
VVKIIYLKTILKTLLKATLQHVWNFTTTFATEDIEPNTFLFIFSNINDQEKVLLQTPWNIKRNPLFLKSWDLEATLKESHITLRACWVQIYGIPVQFMTT